MTLEDLLIKAKAAIDAFEEKTQFYTTTGIRRHWNPETIIKFWERGDHVSARLANLDLYELGQQAYTACMIWKIAHDEGMDAAMLHKLTHGGAQ